MEVNKIMSADILDIIFEGRNKDYGAYKLRKTYNARMIVALFITAVLVTFLFVTYVIAGSSSKEKVIELRGPDVELKDVKDEEIKKRTLPLPPPVKPLKVETVKSTTIKIVKDDEVKESDRPPAVEKLEETKIGVINKQGIKDEEIVAPPVNYEGKGIIDAPKKDESGDDEIFRKVEIESSYPGGMGAWMRYLNKTFRYPKEAQDDIIEGTVVVQFIVDLEGNVSDVEAISGPSTGGLRDEAIRVIKKSGKWEPAIQNGRKVKSYKKQPITFKLERE